MGFHTFDYGNKSTLVYLQNSGSWSGDEFSSSVFACNGSVDEIESLANHAANFVFRTHHDYPIRWKDVMNSKLLKHENIEGDRIGEEFRNKCFIVDDVHFKGAFIGGGKTYDSELQEPELTENHIPIESKSNGRIIMNVCSFEGGIHTCNVEIRTGKIDDIRVYQNTILKMVSKRERAKWADTSHRKKDSILQKMDVILKKIQ